MCRVEVEARVGGQRLRACDDAVSVEQRIEPLRPSKQRLRYAPVAPDLCSAGSPAHARHNPQPQGAGAPLGRLPDASDKDLRYSVPCGPLLRQRFLTQLRSKPFMLNPLELRQQRPVRLPVPLHCRGRALR